MGCSKRWNSYHCASDLRVCIDAEEPTQDCLYSSNSELAVVPCCIPRLLDCHSCSHEEVV